MFSAPRNRRTRQTARHLAGARRRAARAAHPAGSGLVPGLAPAGPDGDGDPVERVRPPRHHLALAAAVTVAAVPVVVSENLPADAQRDDTAVETAVEELTEALAAEALDVVVPEHGPLGAVVATLELSDPATDDSDATGPAGDQQAAATTAPPTTAAPTTAPSTTAPATRQAAAPPTAPPTTAPPTTAAPTTAPPTSAPAEAPKAQAPPAPDAAREAAPAARQRGQASWYRQPASYEADGCAHRTLPFGTVVTVTNLATGASTTCTVSDRGPFVDGRVIDLDDDVYARLAPLSSGVIDVEISW